MKRPSFASEAELATLVAVRLATDGWAIFEEVTFDGKRADLVATRLDEESGRTLVAVVECKLTLGFDVFAQADHWISKANLVWVAVPAAKPSPGRAIAVRCAKGLGLGVFEVTHRWATEREPAVEEVAQPTLQRMVGYGLLQALEPGHQTHAMAGTRSGGHLTPFRKTVEGLAAFSRERPGASLREALSHVDSHYTSVVRAGLALKVVQLEGKLAPMGLEIRTGDDGAETVWPVEEREAS